MTDEPASRVNSAAEPHLPDVEPVPSPRHDGEPIADFRAIGLVLLAFALVLLMMYFLTHGRG